MSCKPLTQEEWQASVAEAFNSAVESVYRDMIDEAVKAEREACAKVCETLDAWNEDDPGSSAATAIRARNNT